MSITHLTTSVKDVQPLLALVCGCDDDGRPAWYILDGRPAWYILDGRPAWYILDHTNQWRKSK